jgi:antitoxin component HigA of HigAB toxin-antitoxin module
MYPNLNAEMSRIGIEQKDIARVLGKGADGISLKINGKRAWLLEEAKKIKSEFFPNLSIDYLFISKEDTSIEREK